LHALLDVQSASELQTVRVAASTTVKAVNAGIRAIRPGVTQHSVESLMSYTCSQSGAHGTGFWPWAMSGEAGVFPRPVVSFTRYDHLDRTMKAGDLVRIDAGCEVGHYSGDLGRTVPVSGKFTDEQREVWDIFVAAYLATVKELRDGATGSGLFDVWSDELLRHRATAKSALARQAIDEWSDADRVPYWQIHTINLVEGFVRTLRAGMTIALEPIMSIGGQGYYLEDMFLITKDGAELLTPGLPYTAAEIEKVMAGN